MLFPVGISNLINFVFHVFFGVTAAKFIGWEDSPFQAEVGFCQPRHWHCRSHCIQSKLTISSRYIYSSRSFLIGRGWWSCLSNGRSAQFCAGERRVGSSKRHPHSGPWIRVSLAFI